MITLYAFGPGFDLPEASPYCLKAEVQLKMAQRQNPAVAYQKDYTGFPAAPKGKLPYLADNGTVVPDSTFMRGYIERTYGVDLDAGLSPEQWAQSWALERMLEDHLNWVMGYTRWLIPENFAKGPAHFFDQAPEEIRDKLRAEALAKVTANHQAHGLGRHSLDEIIELGRRSLAALSGLLGDKPYLFGDEPAAVDATAFGVLACILSPYMDSGLRQAALRLPNLSAYVDRMMARFYPEHAWPLEAKAA